MTQEEKDKVTRLAENIGREFHDDPNALEFMSTLIDVTEPMVSRRRFGSQFYMAAALLVCHQLKMFGYGDNSFVGTVANTLQASSYSEGETAFSSGASQATSKDPDGEYALTVYGLRFLNLRRTLIIPIINSGEG